MKKNSLLGYENIIGFPDMMYEMMDEGDVLEVRLARCTPQGVVERTAFTAVLYKAELYDENGRLRRYVGLSPVAATIGELTLQTGTIYGGGRWLELVSAGDKEPWTVCFPATVHWQAAEDISARYRDAVETLVAGAF